MGESGLSLYIKLGKIILLYRLVLRDKGDTTYENLFIIFPFGNPLINSLGNI